MENLENWKEVTRGIYRYVIAAKACYEIHVWTWNCNTDILKSECALYIVGEWRYTGKKKPDSFTREALYEGKMEDCLAYAVKDYEENK